MSFLTIAVRRGGVRGGILSNLSRCGRNTRDGAREEEETVYHFYFHNAGNQFKIDASRESGRFGRLVTNSIVVANTNVKVMVVDNVPRLFSSPRGRSRPGRKSSATTESETARPGLPTLGL